MSDVQDWPIRCFAGYLGQVSPWVARSIPDIWQILHDAGPPPEADHRCWIGVVTLQDMMGRQDYFCGWRVPSAKAVPRGWSSLHLPAGRWLAFAAVSGPWAPANQVQVARQEAALGVSATGLMVSAYPQDFNVVTGLGPSEIWTALT